MRLASLIVLSLLIGGCTSGGGSSAGDNGSGSDPDAERGVGAIAGLVLDDERRPLPGADVRLMSLGRNETTNAEGRFSFAQVPAGNHTLNATLGGFEALEQAAKVQAGRTTFLNLLLVPLPADVSFHESFPYGGLQQCMIYTSVFLASCSYPYTAVHGTLLRNGVNLSQYGAPADPLTNRYRYNFSARPGFTGVVSELVWTAQTDASRYYKLILGCPWYDPVIDDCVPPGSTAPTSQSTYAVARGVSPLRIELRTQDVPSTWLPWIMSRAYLSGPVDRPAGVALDQRIDMYNTVFYGAPVPDQWSYLTST